VVLIERSEIAAGASGRNSGAIQHPFDSPMADLYRESLALYRELPGFKLALSPAGLLVVSDDGAGVAAAAAEIDGRAPDLKPTVLTPVDVRSLEPAVADGLYACRLETGYPVAPAAATLAFAARAERAGARLMIGSAARPVVVAGRVEGVELDSGERIAADQVLVAAGPWAPALVPGWASMPPIRAVWGVVVGAQIDGAPAHVLEELGIDRPGMPPEAMFSLVTVGGRSSVGSTFLEQEPDPARLVAPVMARAARHVPAIGRVRPAGTRLCARPVSLDGRPLIGAVAGIDGLFVCAGHGPWGISTGPASARMVSRQMADGLPVTPAFDPSRFTPA
jgi:glycine/D-amino acid oxidase-like deaminating enzyme